MPAKLEADLAEAKGKLAVLEDERAGLTERITAAVRGADAEAVLKLRRGLSELPSRILAERSTVLRLEILQADAEQEGWRAQLPGLHRRVEEAEARIKKAKEEEREARYARSRVVSMQAAVRDKRLALSAQLDAILGEALKP